MDAANPLTLPSPGGYGNLYSGIDGKHEQMNSPHELVPHTFAGILIVAAGALFLLKRSGFVDISVRGSAGGR